MFTKGNKVYADAGYYLRHKEYSVIGFTVIGDMDDYNEIRLPENLDIIIENGMVFIYNRMFAIIPDSVSYADIKKQIIKSRYSDDDQMALLLNKDKSEEDLELYNKMQEWRDFASFVARKAMELWEQ
jgi:hypothetical protein